MSQKILTVKLLIAFTTACLLGFFDGSYRPAHAGAQNIVIDIPVYGQTPYSNLTAQAESLVRNAINRQFGQDTGLLNVQVFVMGDRNGEVIPLLTTSVSRTQWQQNPQVSAWTRYYSVSYALLQRQDQKEIVALAPVGSTSISAQERSFLIDKAFDSGHLDGQVAQKYLSDLD